MLTVSEGMLNIVFAAATHKILKEKKQDTFKYTFINVLYGCEAIKLYLTERLTDGESFLHFCRLVALPLTWSPDGVTVSSAASSLLQ